MSEYIEKLLKNIKKNVAVEKFEEGKKEGKSGSLEADIMNTLKEVFNLKTLREMTETPETRLRSFRRFVAKDIGRYDSYGTNYSNVKLEYIKYDRFWKEANYLKDLQVDDNPHVKMSREYFYLDDMTNEQILCYYTLVKDFKKNKMGRFNVYYAKYYMLEVANLLYQKEPEDALETMFHFWDALVEAKKRTYDDPYLINLCDLFMIAHESLIPKVREGLKERSCIAFDRGIYGELQNNDYRHAKEFVLHNARLLKEEEISGEEDYIKATWSAMPYVFEALAEQFASEKCSFLQTILKGGFHYETVRAFPMKNYISKNYNRRMVSKYEFYEWNKYMERWEKRVFELQESVQDFLKIIQLYTESFFRDLFFAKSKRKRSATRVLNKGYTTTLDDAGNINRIKKILKNPLFEQAIKDGIMNYLKEENVGLPQKEVKSTYTKQIYDMDHAKVQTEIAQIDLDKLKRAREEAQDVMGLLQSGEIEYDKPVKDKTVDDVKREDKVLQTSVDATVRKENTEHPSEIVWEQNEISYLQCLLEEDAAGSQELLHQLQMPENVMIKQINKKALELFSDVLLEKENGETYIVEDYMDELKKMLG